jgi:hypothetical protein
MEMRPASSDQWDALELTADPDQGVRFPKQPQIPPAASPQWLSFRDLLVKLKSWQSHSPSRVACHEASARVDISSFR